MLADAVVALNKVAAVLIIIVFMIFGWGYGHAAGYGAVWPIIGGMVGAVIGIFAAGFVCGIVALLALIENHLRVLAERGKKPAPVVAPGSARSAA